MGGSTWGQILAEIQKSAHERGQLGPDLDGIRLKYLLRLREHTGRAVITYASGWLRSGSGELAYSVEGGDVHALMEVCHDVGDKDLDLILHSPGGSPQAAEQMLNYLRTQFDHIRAIVPLQAKSAATMMALGCDEIVMGDHSELGPIDPQILVPVPEGQRYAPAHAILRDFERAKDEMAENVNALPAWTPILRSYAGGLLEFCNQQILLSQEVVAGWLERYMLTHDDAAVSDEDRPAVARELAHYFGSDEAYDRFRTHGRPIRVEELLKIRGLRIRRLEDDDELQDRVLGVYHALDHTFGGPAIKIVENHLGRRHVRIRREIVFEPGPAPVDLPSPPGRTIPNAPGPGIARVHARPGNKKASPKKKGKKR